MIRTRTGCFRRAWLLALLLLFAVANAQDPPATEQSGPVPPRAAPIMPARAAPTTPAATDPRSLDSVGTSTPWTASASSPAAAAVALDTAFRSLRELQLTVPLHRLLLPSLDARVRFGGGRNFSTARIDALADPLFWGYRRLLLDLYWDAGRNAWQVCPVAYPFPLETAVNATRFSGEDVTLDVPPADRERLGGATTVVCRARPGGDDWARALRELYDYVQATHNPTQYAFVVVGLRTWDLGVPPRNATAAANGTATALLPTPTVAPVPVVTTSASLTVVNGTTSTVLVPVTLPAATPTPTSTTPSLEPTQTPFTALADQLRLYFNSTLFTPRLMSNLTSPSSQQNASSLLPPWHRADSRYNTARTLVFPTLGDLIRHPVQPRRRIAFVAADRAFFARPPAGYNGTAADADVLFPRDLMLTSDWPAGSDAVVPLGVPAGVPPTVPFAAIAGAPVSATQVPDAPWAAPPALIDCPRLAGPVVAAAGNESVSTLSPEPDGGSRVPSAFLTLGDTRDRAFTFASASVAAGCGFAPHVANPPPAGVDTDTYLKQLLVATVWPWPAMQPANDTAAVCALATTTALHVGTGPGNATGAAWVPARCLDLHYVACQNTSDPHDWRLSTAKFAWFDAAAATVRGAAWANEGQAGGDQLADDLAARGSNRVLASPPCPAGTAFAVPRTPSQNWYLTRVLVANGVDHAWTFFSAVRTTGCWTVGGDRCAYASDDGGRIQEIITVSLIGGLLVLLTVGVFLWIKCRRYNRVSKTEARHNEVKKRIKRIEYSSVPA
ncbi:Maintenance of telomere capping protein 6 [Blastocladiella emersonii ATCC 22665]|nr:Maintenance of telomere capping protein 6 [Blastocladiella emersonii ATCC 22665]